MSVVGKIPFVRVIRNVKLLRFDRVSLFYFSSVVRAVEIFCAKHEYLFALNSFANNLDS